MPSLRSWPARIPLRAGLFHSRVSPDAITGRGPQRRTSDPRIDDLLDMVRAFSGKIDRLDDRINQLREEEAARRVKDDELLRRVTNSETHHAEQDRRIGTLEDDGIKLRAEMRGAISVLKWLVSITSAIGAVTSILVALHAVGVIP